MKKLFSILGLSVLLGFVWFGPVLHAQANTAAATTTILTPADTAKIAPPTVFFRGQSASLQARNTFGIRYVDSAVVLMGLVDSSGYSTGIQQKYQGYFLTEVPLEFSGMRLAPGAYGFGFIGSNAFIIMDLGAHELLRVQWTRDAAMPRPRPLQIVNGAHADQFRLYEGRKFVSFQRAK